MHPYKVVPDEHCSQLASGLLTKEWLIKTSLLARRNMQISTIYSTLDYNIFHATTVRTTCTVMFMSDAFKFNRVSG